MTPLADQLRGLGLDGVSAIAELAELDGERFDPAKTLERLRMSLAFYERELEEMYKFAATWRAPIEEVTDNAPDYRAMAARLREAIKLLEGHVHARR